MKLFNLGELNWRQTQLVYHALAYENIESLVLYSSRDSYMCVGLHQNPREELDLDYCTKNNIGIFRREIGGGAVLLDKNQVFYSLILNRRNPIVPYAPESFFRKFLNPVIEAYHEIGITANFNPLCDLVVKRKKISGNGGGEIGECKVLSGNILLDFDYGRMANSVLLPEILQERFLDLIQKNLTTVKRELGFIPSKEEICSILATKFSNLLGPMLKGRIDTKINKKIMELDKQYSSDTWLYQRGTKQIGREIKICEGVFLFHIILNHQKGSVEITFEIEDDRVKKVIFSDNFSLSNIDHNKLEEQIIDLKYNKDELVNKIIMIIKNHGGIIVA